MYSRGVSGEPGDRSGRLKVGSAICDWSSDSSGHAVVRASRLTTDALRADVPRACHAWLRKRRTALIDTTMSVVGAVWTGLSRSRMVMYRHAPEKVPPIVCPVEVMELRA